MKKLTLTLILGLILYTAVSAQDLIKYPIEKGSVTYAMSMMGSDNTVIMYFNNKGNNSCMDMQMEMFGMKMHNRTIMKGKTNYTLDMGQKKYTETVMSEEDLKKNANFFSDDNGPLPEGVTKVGEETILDKPCKIYTMTKEGADIKLWTWKGLMLKMETQAMGMTINMLAKSISEETPDASFFEVPSDFTKVDQLTPGQ